MKKRKLYIALCLFLLLTGVFAGNMLFQNTNIVSFNQPIRNSFLEGVTGIFSSEPTEIQELRKKEYPEHEEGHLEYYYQQLTEKEKRAYREILDGVRARKAEFYITISLAEELDRTYHAVLKDHPEIFWIHNRKEVYRTTFGDSDYCLFAPAYCYTENECAEIKDSIELAYQEVLSLLPEDADEYEKAKTVYTYVIDQTEYELSDDDQSIAGVFWKQSAVCAGYAGAAQYLLERLGIFCIYVDGDVKDRQDGHAWNIIKIDGEYYYLDATNGDQPEFLKGDAAALAEHKTTIMDYLCPFPEEYEQNYTAVDEFALPSCTSHTQNFYIKNNGCFDTYDRQTLYEYCCMRIDFNAAVVRFKFSNEEALQAVCEEWIDQGAVQDVAQYYMQTHDLYEVQYHYGVLEDLKSVYFIF